MKRNIIIFIIMFGFISVSIVQSQTVTVSGAGDSWYNGTYNYLQMTNGKYHYRNPSSLMELFYNETNGWVLTPPGGPYVSYYMVNSAGASAELYPDNGNDWDVVNGTAPAPTTVYDNSLPVEVSQISARVERNSVIITWVTESEVDNIGFIMERSDNDMRDWIELASYLYHDNMKGMGNSSERTEYHYIDSGIINGKTYQYRLSDVDINGKVRYHKPIKIKITKAPILTIMEKAYPNPFNPVTSINYQLDENLNIKIHVYDLSGRLIKKLFTGQQMAGSYSVYWNGTNENGNKVASGSYIINMHSKNINQSQKVILLK